MSLANFGANACYWQARYEPDSAGTPDRTLVCYKYDASASDPILANGTRYPWANFFYQSRLTTTWRDPIINRPEANFLGTQYHGDPFYGDITVTNTAHWIYKNTGLNDNDKLTGLLGYELDTVDPAGPANLAILAASPDTWGTSNMTYYEHRGGGGVFSTGSMNFVWGLDNYPSAWVWPPVNYVTPKAQQMVRNVLYRMTTGKLP
jgi:hypothetical protein